MLPAGLSYALQIYHEKLLSSFSHGDSVLLLPSIIYTFIFPSLLFLSKRLAFLEGGGMN